MPEALCQGSGQQASPVGQVGRAQVPRGQSPLWLEGLLTHGRGEEGRLVWPLASLTSVPSGASQALLWDRIVFAMTKWRWSCQQLPCRHHHCGEPLWEGRAPWWVHGENPRRSALPAVGLWNRPPLSVGRSVQPLSGRTQNPPDNLQPLPLPVTRPAAEVGQDMASA